MKIDEKLVDNLADLSKLEFNREGKKEIISDLNKILEFVGKLDELDTDSVEPLIHISTEENVLRDDEANQPISREEALKNAPDKQDGFFRVPKVVKKGK